MKFFRFLLVIVAVSLMSFKNSTLWASCGCSSCPIDTHSSERSEKGILRLDYSFEYIDQSTPRIGREKAAVGEIEGEHNEIYSVNRIHRLGAEYGITDRLSLEALIPYVNRSHQHLHVEDDELETWDLSGLGDVTLQSRYAFIKPEENSHPTIAGLFGVKFPTGKRHEKNHDEQEAEVGVQPGSGAYSFIFGASTLQKFSVPTLKGLYSSMPFFVSTSYQLNQKGTLNYKLGNIWLFNVGTVYPVLPKVGFMAQANLKVTGHDGQGDTDQQVERTGGTFVYVSPGIQVSLTDNLLSYVTVQIPVYQRVNVIQLTSSSNWMAGVSYRFKVVK